LPNTEHYHQALTKGDTLEYFKPCIHWVECGFENSKESWLWDMRANGWRTVAVELDTYSTPLNKLGKTGQPTIVLLGNETRGLPSHVIADADELVEIPMLGVGHSLNVAVAGSLVSYKLAGLL